MQIFLPLPSHRGPEQGWWAGGGEEVTPKGQGVPVVTQPLVSPLGGR